MQKLGYIGEAPLNELLVTSSTRKRCRNDVVGGTNDNGSDIDENHGNIAKRANDSEGKGKGEGKGENNADSSRCGGGIGNGGNSKAKKEKPKKDPNARGVPGTFIFYHYQNDMQPIIRIELPNLTSQEVVSILGKRWQAMTSDEKRSYNDLRNEDKRRHQREIASLRQAAKGVDDDTNARVIATLISLSVSPCPSSLTSIRRQEALRRPAHHPTLQSHPFTHRRMQQEKKQPLHWNQIKKTKLAKMIRIYPCLKV